MYLIVRGVESCEFKHNNETVRSSHVSYENKITIAGASEIQNGQVYNWEGVIELPVNTNPLLGGKIIDHKWEIQAGLDMGQRSGLGAGRRSPFRSSIRA